MTENKVVVLGQTGQCDDPLAGILRSGAKLLIAQAVKAVFEPFLSDHADKMPGDGRRRFERKPMVVKLVAAASKNWPRLQAHSQLPKIIAGVKFRYGIEAVPKRKSAALFAQSP